MSPLNDFQMGLETARRAMTEQKGVRVRIPRTAFKGHWRKAPKLCTGYVVGAARTGKFVARARFAGETDETLLTPSALMLAASQSKWRAVARFKAVRDARLAGASKHRNAVRRATDMMSALLDAGVPLAGKTVLTLDGIGTNRVGFTAALDARGVTRRPEILTCEMDAAVALAQTVALGVPSEQVLFTGGDPALRGGAHATRAVTVEDLITRPNALLSEDKKKRVVFLNLDYCGGPPAGRDLMARVVDHLPALRAVAYTVAKRNHPDLARTFDVYIPPPYGFVLARTYTDNAHVLCKLYLRDARVPRALTIPGMWWKHVTAAERKRTYAGAVRRRVGPKTYAVYVPSDDREYVMRTDAVRAYCADA